MQGKQIAFKNKSKNLVSKNLSGYHGGVTPSSQQRSHTRVPSTKLSKDAVDIVKIDLTRKKVIKKMECDDVADEHMKSEGDMISSLTTTEHGEALSNMELHHYFPNVSDSDNDNITILDEVKASNFFEPDKIDWMTEDNPDQQFQTLQRDEHIQMVGQKKNQSSHAVTRLAHEQSRNHHKMPQHKRCESNEGQLLKIIENNRVGTEHDIKEQRKTLMDGDLKLTKQSNTFNYKLNEIDRHPTIKKHIVKLQRHFEPKPQSSGTPRSAINNDKYFSSEECISAQDLNGQRADSEQVDDMLQQNEASRMRANGAWMNFVSGEFQHTNTGDRFISIRDANDDTNGFNGACGQGQNDKFDTKIELFKINHVQEEKQRKDNQLVCDHLKTEQTLQEIENKKTYVTLLQNQLLGIQNKSLLSELHNTDENYMNKSLYSQLQLQADIEPVRITQSEQNKEDDSVNDQVNEQNNMNDNNDEDKNKDNEQSPFTQEKLQQILYSGAFAYTSPPERVMLSDNVYQYGSFGNNQAADSTKYEQESTPFNSKFTVLKFNSDSQNKAKMSRSPKKMNSIKKSKVNVFKLYQKEQHQHIGQTKLLDFGIKETIITDESKFFKDGPGYPDINQSRKQGGMLQSERTASSENPSNNLSYQCGLLASNLSKYSMQEENNMSRNSQSFWGNGSSGLMQCASDVSDKENPDILPNNNLGKTSLQTDAESRNSVLKSLLGSSNEHLDSGLSHLHQVEQDLDLTNMFQPSPFLGLGNHDDGHNILEHKQERNISKIPYKVLDAPQLSDDFYLNLVDWSESNHLAVGLMSSVYIWSASSSAVIKLHEYSQNHDGPASVCWSRQGGNYLATGTLSGVVQLWDAHTQKLIRTYQGHEGRVAALSWTNSNMLSTGSKDRTILNRDMRVKEHYISRIEAHKQEVCGIKWSFDDRYLASGGNDNKLKIWEANQQRANQPLFKFTSHKAAVKAIAWSPHQTNIVASGGGTADRQIKFWNTQCGVELQSISTGSQVCSLMFSKSSNELVSTHGFQDNAVVVWKYPSMKKLATLTGHQYRVLYLAMSPDSETIVTGAGDETLRFWKVFPKNKNARSFCQTDLCDNVDSDSKLAVSSCFIR